MFIQLALTVALWQEPSVGQVLDNVREAVGYSQLAGGRGVELKGSAVYVGMETTFQFLFAPQGQYNFAITGRAGQVYGWDGSIGWEADYSGATGRTHLEALEHQHAFSWVVAHRWLAPDGPYDVTLAEVEPGGDSYTLNLKLKGGHLVQTVVVDDETWLPEATRFNSTVGEHAVFFKEWKRTDHGSFPYRIETDDVGVKGSFTVEGVRAMPVFRRSPFTMPGWSVEEDTRYDRSKEGKVEVKRAPTGHIMVKPTIGGEDVGWFILDSGSGGMVIDTAVAERLGGEGFGEMLVGGVGGVSTSSFFQYDGFSLGAATVDGLLFIDIDLAQFSDVFGLEIGGIVGYDFFRRTRVEIDLQEAEVSVYDPRGEAGEADWLELVLDNRHPTIEAEFEGGRTGRFRIDTGADGTVSFNRHTVVEHGMLDGRETSAVRQGGIGGFVESKMGQLEYFAMAGHRWDDLRAVFAVDDGGLHGGTYLDGNLGQDLLRAFRLVFDYPNERIAMIEKRLASTTGAMQWPAPATRRGNHHLLPACTLNRSGRIY